MTLTVRRRIGDIDITILNDGATEFDNDIFPDQKPSKIEELLSYSGKSVIETSINCCLIRTNDECILVDTGARDLFGPVAGRIPQSLEEAGVSPEQITHLVLTHLHPDHIGGALTTDGDVVFKNAEVSITKAEHQYWVCDQNFSSADEQVLTWRNIALHVLQSYDDRINLVSSMHELVSGVHFLDLPGHTPGHIGLRIESTGSSFIYATDIFHAQDLQLADPTICALFDIDKESAIKSRSRALDMLALDGTEFSSGHMLMPALSRVEKYGSAYKFVDS